MLTIMSNSTSISEEATASSETRANDFTSLSSLPYPHPQQPPQLKTKKKRSQPGNPDPDAEVVALSPKSLMTTNRFVCEICNKGFQRDQNLQLHRRGHNLPWKLRQKGSKEVVRKRVYVCPEASCVHHQPSRALGDLTGIKKHFSRKHGEKKWRCDKCSKTYAVHSDWKAHVKTCGTREYRCDCGTLFSRKDSFITHRAFCEALAEESARLIAAAAAAAATTTINPPLHHHPLFLPFPPIWDPLPNPNPNPNPALNLNPNPNLFHVRHAAPLLHPYIPASPHLSATAVVQKAYTVGPTSTTTTTLVGPDCPSEFEPSAWQSGDRLTRDFLGIAAGEAEVEEEDELTSLTAGLGLDLVTASNGCGGGDHTAKPANLAALGFSPVTGTWGDC